MLDARLLGLLPSLSESEYVTSQSLADKHAISDRTVQTRIRKLREELEGHGATIESRQRHGYRLVIQDRNAYLNWYQSELDRQTQMIPNSAEERFTYLLARFLETDQYLKLEDLSEELFVSSKTLSAELRHLEFVLSHYHLTIDRKARYGLYIKGGEFEKRKCWMDYLLHPDCAEWSSTQPQMELTSKIGEVLLDVMLRHRIKFSEAAFQNIVIYLYVTDLRTRSGHTVEADPEKLRKVQAMEEYNVAQLLVGKLREMGVHILDAPAEFMYIAVYIAGRRNLSDEYKLQTKPVLLDDVKQLSTLLLDCIQQVYNLDFCDNLNILISLYNHLTPFHIRMMYNIPLQNPILDETKQNYPFAFAMAQRGVVELEKFYGKTIPEDETGYFAIILEMALESLKEHIEKKRSL